MVEKENLNLINMLQNPSLHYVGDQTILLSTHNVDAKNEVKWIAFEDKFSIENFSGLAGKGLHEIVIAMTIINMQAGITSGYLDKLIKIPKDKMTRLYYKFQKERKKSYSKNIFNIVCYWLKEKSYISELELNRLLNYNVEHLKESLPLDDFNHELFQSELRPYAQEYWNDIERH